MGSDSALNVRPKFPLCVREKYGTFFLKKFEKYLYRCTQILKKMSSQILVWIRIRIRSGFSDFVDPDWAKMLDPYPDPQPWLK
jgi:hypothetical protein